MCEEDIYKKIQKFATAFYENVTNNARKVTLMFK